MPSALPGQSAGQLQPFPQSWSLRVEPMLFRYTRLWLAFGLLAGMWALSAVRRTDPRAWVHPAGAQRGPVRILQFYASVGILNPGDKAMLCYGVENARSVKISPALDDVYPST